MKDCDMQHMIFLCLDLPIQYLSNAPIKNIPRFGRTSKKENQIIEFYLWLFDRPRLVGAVLQTASLLINFLIC